MEVSFKSYFLNSDAALHILFGVFLTVIDKLSRQILVRFKVVFHQRISISISRHTQTQYDADK